MKQLDIELHSVVGKGFSHAIANIGMVEINSEDVDAIKRVAKDSGFTHCRMIPIFGMCVGNITVCKL